MKNNITALLVILTVCAAPAVFSANYTDRIDERYRVTVPLPDGYAIAPDGENAWSKTYRMGLKKNSPFLLLMSVIRYGNRPINIDEVKRQVISTGTKFLSKAVEKELVTHEIVSGRVIGYYYGLTDPAPKKGEYRKMLQGEILNTRSILTFTYLFNDENAAERETVLSIIRGVSVSFTEKSPAALSHLRLQPSDLGGRCAIGETLYCTTFQVRAYFSNPEIYDRMLPPLAEKSVQSIEGSGEKGSVICFRYRGSIEAYRGFFTGLFYGDDRGPSQEHPEEMVIRGDTMVVFCFQKQSALKDQVKPVILGRLR